MNPITATFDLPRILYAILALVVWSAITFGAGYGYKWHRDSLADASRQTRQDTAVTTTKAAVTASDTQTVNRLQTALQASKLSAESLETLLKAQSHATPAPADCALPVGLRDQINADIAGGTR